AGRAGQAGRPGPAGWAGRAGRSGRRREAAMKKIAMLLALAASGPMQAQADNPLTAGARMHYGIIKGYVTRAAAKMPEENYSFRATPEVRTFAQLVGHLADANYRLCSVLAGESPVIDAGIERDKHSKADLIKALDESFTYCD